MEGYFIGKTGRDWYVCKVSDDGPRRVLTGTLVDVVNFMAGVAGEDGVPEPPGKFEAATFGESGKRRAIGDGRRREDGVIEVHLDALPVDGLLYLRPLE